MKTKNVIIVIIIVLASALLGLVSCSKDNINPIEGIWQFNDKEYVFTDNTVIYSSINPEMYVRGTYIIDANNLELFIGYLKTEYSYEIKGADTLYLITEFKNEYKFVRK